MTTTSIEARDQHEAKGTAELHRKTILRLVRLMPGSTAVELHRWQHQWGVSLDRHEISRRLPELRKSEMVRNGEPRACTVSGTKQMTWFPVEAATQRELF